ncbi:hypothetical protein LUZ60_015972 [Juncus effusus]|nr:hypothetical protein LUZ60_015972 [Juncus effusus]
MTLKEEEKTEPDADLTTKTNNSSSPVHPQTQVSSPSAESDAQQPLCRVCHCTESDLRGHSALALLGISPPKFQNSDSTSNLDSNSNSEKQISSPVKFVSPKGEVFVCDSDDLESGPTCQDDILINLGCSCKNELSLSHYACALKWFVNHGSTICEICGAEAQNVRNSDFKKVLASLKDYDALRENTITGELRQLRRMDGDNGVDPDAIAGIRRQRLSEISSWFNPRNSSSVFAVSHEGYSESENDGRGIAGEGIAGEERRVARVGLQGTGVIVVTGLVVVIFAWLIAPHVGKKAAIMGVHLILGGLCSITLVIFLTFVFPRIKYGPNRNWAVAFIFLFLAFGVWVSRTRNIRTS